MGEVPETVGNGDVVPHAKKSYEEDAEASGKVLEAGAREGTEAGDAEGWDQSEMRTVDKE